MARRRRVELETNHERWMVSYADFVTLLFAFFVVMYSISTVNDDKYRVLSDAMEEAFRRPGSTPPTVPPESMAVFPWPLEQGEPGAGESGLPRIPLRQKDAAMSASQAVEQDDEFSAEVLAAAEQEVHAISDVVEDKMQESIDDEMIEVTRNKFWLEVEIKSSLLFDSGSSELIPESLPVLLELSGIFAGLDNRIHIEGFTDNEPIRTSVFPSNWELSAARAAAVVRLFERNGIHPARLATIGYGQYQPVTSNATEDGRARNRRVVLVVMASQVGGSKRIHEFELLKDRALAQFAP